MGWKKFIEKQQTGQGGMMFMKFKFIRLEIKDDIGIVTVNRPPINAVNNELHREMTHMFNSIINNNDELRVVIMRAEGKTFMAGNDLKELGALNKETVVETRDTLKEAMNAVYYCRVPVIGAVNGAAVGGGLCYCACCDILVAAEDAFFGLPEVKVAIVGAAAFLRQMVPKKVAYYMALTGQNISAQEMHKYGAVLKVVHLEELMDEAMKVAKILSAQPPLVQQDFKKAMHINEDARLGEKYDIEMSFTTHHLETEDFKEGISAFFERRIPQFKGR